MTNLNSRGGLAIAEVTFYAPALLLAIAVCIKQGFNRSQGWLYSVLICILRLIGASCTLYMETKQDYSAGLITTAAITSAIGTAPLLLALLGFLQRINGNMSYKSLSPMVFRPIHLVALVALILGIVGGTDMAGSNPSDAQTGKHLMEAASAIFLVVYLANTGLTILLASRKSHVASTDMKLLVVCLCALPFLLVRVAYTIATAFSNPGSVFYSRSVNIWIQAFMMFAMEVLIVSLYIYAGLLSPKQGKTAVKDTESKNMEMGSQSQQERAYAQRGEYVRTEQPRREERSIGDYRPSRLIRDAISGRR